MARPAHDGTAWARDTLAFAAVIFVGYRMSAGSCPAPTFIEIGTLTVIPVVYLVFMYLTLTSQE